MYSISKVFVATLLIVTWLQMSDAETKSKIESTSQSIVSRLNPALRKALLKALTNIENDETTELNGIQETTEDELLEESTKADLKSLNLYNSYLTDGAQNFTQKNENEIIHTIILKKAKMTEAPTDRSRQDDQVIIQFGAPDPVKDSDVHIETVQIARSVKTNEIEDGDGDSENNNSDEHQNDFEVTTYKPVTTADTTTTTAESTRAPTRTTSTTTTTTTTTTEAPTHNEDGENIEKVSKNDVKIYQAPLVAAFTVQQDAQGLPKNIIPLIHSVRTPPAVARPIQQFTISSSTSVNTTPKVPLIVTTPLNPLTLELPSVNSAPSFTLSKSLELPSTKEAAFTTFALEQKRKQLEEQIAQLQAQQRQTEESFRQQQAYQEHQALRRQQELLLQQRYRFEEENRARLQRYEQEQQLLRQQQFQNSHFLTNLPTLNQFTPPPTEQSVQVIPSLSFPTQQLLPVREATEFRSKPPSFTPSQPLPIFSGQTSPLLSPNPQLPLKPAQQFISGIVMGQSSLNIDPIAISDQTRSRNRVFRQESGTGNFGLNSINTNFPPIYPIYNVDSQLQNLLVQSGIGRSNEDLNIISKVLSLNHGISLPTSGSSTFYPTIQGRFIRSAPN